MLRQVGRLEQPRFSDKLGMANGRVGSVKLLTEYVLEYILTLKQVGCHIASQFFVHTVGCIASLFFVHTRHCRNLYSNIDKGKNRKNTSQKDINKQQTQHLN